MDELEPLDVEVITVWLKVVPIRVISLVVMPVDAGLYCISINLFCVIACSLWYLSLLMNPGRVAWVRLDMCGFVLCNYLIVIVGPSPEDDQKDQGAYWIQEAFAGHIIDGGRLAVVCEKSSEGSWVADGVGLESW
jgi:hypothetical protein